MRDINKVTNIVEKFLPIISEEPYDDISFRIMNEKGLFFISFTYRVPEDLYRFLESGTEESKMNRNEIAQYTYDMIKQINQYFGLKLMSNYIGFSQKY
jgi:hypothetical protein